MILGCTLLIAPKGELGDAFGWLQGRKGPGVKFVVETVPERVHGEFPLTSPPFVSGSRPSSFGTVTRTRASNLPRST